MIDRDKDMKYRVDHQICLKCGKKLKYGVDTKKTGVFFVKCKSCREIEKIRAFGRKKEYEKTKKLTDEEIAMKQYQEGEKCMICDERVLYGSKYKARKTCPICMGEYNPQMSKAEKMSIYSVCRRCKWAVFHGDHLSCMSANGTGPRDKSCLRYSAERKAEDDSK